MVIVVDWTGVAKCNLKLQEPIARAVAKVMFHYVKAWKVPLEVTRCMGFGVGAHVCGFLGMEIRSNGSQLAILVGKFYSLCTSLVFIRTNVIILYLSF